MPKKKGRQSLGSSFVHAWEGVLTTIETERNMKIHVVATILVVLLGLYVGLSPVEWSICILLCGVVMSLEVLNSALEAVVDMLMPRPHPLAKKAKDAAAGAVLVSAIAAVCIGVLLFGPKLIGLYKTLFC